MEIKAYKGFYRNQYGQLIAKGGFVYEVGKTYEIEEHNLEFGECGFHACEVLKDCLQFYPNDHARIVYHEVVCSGRIFETEEGWICCSKITIGEQVEME